jgi:hypothetical protein
MNRILKVVPKDNYLLELTLSDNTIKTLDMKPYLTKGKLAELKDIALFNTARPSFDTIEWSSGVDIDPELLCN